MKYLSKSFFITILAFACLCVVNPNNFCKAYSASDNKSDNLASGYAVVETGSLRILSSANENKKLPMASTTKIITCILTILNEPNLDKIVTVPAEACGIEGSSIYLKEGEHLSIRELLYGLMLSSGNDAAVALALNLFGSLENFQSVANDFCKSIGANNTNVINPNGLHDSKHYTTAYDLAIITSFALKNSTFREIVGTKNYEISNEFKKNKRVLKNKNKMLDSYNGATGVKIGYTKAAGRCLVSSATRDGMELVCVVLNSPNWFNVSSMLLDEAFSKFKLYELLPQYYHLGKVDCLFGDKKSINIISKQGLYFPLADNERSFVKINVQIPNELKAPIMKDDIVGEINIYLKNDLIFSENIYSIDNSISMRVGDIFTRLWSDLLY